MNQRDRSCLEPETIADFVNGTLDEETRRMVAAHIAGCDDCVVAIGEATTFARREVALAAITRRRRLRQYLAIAASLAIIITGAALALRRPVDQWLYRTAIGPMTEAAPGTERRVEGRLTGGFAWSHLHDPGRGAASADPGVVLVRLAATDVLRKSSSKDAARQRHAAGVATLLLGRDDEAIRSLSAAARRSPGDATLWSDLSAAYLEAGQLPAALDASDAALRIDGNLPEALFNRALILERMGHKPEAAAAWRRYLEVDTRTDGWTAEARAHLDALGARTSGPSSALRAPSPHQWGEGPLARAGEGGRRPGEGRTVG